MGRKNKGGKELAQPKDQTPLLPLIARRIQPILRGPNKGRKADHYLVVWEDYPLLIVLVSEFQNCSVLSSLIRH